MKLNVLGTVYAIEKRKFSDDESFEENGWAGYCADYEKKIILLDLTTAPGWKTEAPEIVKRYESETIRHEIIHAFLNESGLKQNCNSSIGPWSKNEEMVDWFAIQGPKIMEAWRKAGCL